MTDTAKPIEQWTDDDLIARAEFYAEWTPNATMAGVLCELARRYAVAIKMERERWELTAKMLDRWNP